MSFAAAVTSHRTLGLAAEMAFWVFLSMVPIEAVAGFVAARVAASHEAILASLLAPAPKTARELIVDQVHRVAAWHGGALAPVAAATFLWLASSGVSAVFEGLEAQSGGSRPWWKRRLLAIGTCVLLSLGTGALAILASGIGWIDALAGTLLHGRVQDLEGSAAWTVLNALVAASLAVVMVATLYRVGVPRSARSRMAIWPGAIAAVVLQAGLGWAYGFYVSKFGAGDAYQAGLAVIAVTMTTLWLFSVALLLGATFNRVVGERRARASTHMASGGK